MSSESDLYFGRYFNISIDTVLGVDCRILYGPSMDDLSGSIDCGLTNQTVFDNITSDQTVVISVVGLNNMAYIQFTYHLVDYVNTITTFSVLGAGLAVIALGVGCYIVFILRVTSGVKIQKINGKLRDSALIMTVELSKARAAFNES